MKKNEDAAAKRKPKTSAAQIRVQKGMCLLSYPTSIPSRRELESSPLLPHIDLTELDLPSTMKTTWPDPADLLNFNLTISPDEGQ
jgi:ubiquitin-conjugating enzyme E2 M